MPDHDYLKTVTIGAPETPKDTIVLCDYDPHWPALYAQEHVKIARALAGQSVRIEHVGSTSVPGLCAKPIIDILLLVDDAASEERYAPALEAAGYTLRVREPDWYEHRMFKGQSPTVNLHVFSQGCDEAQRMLAFRDHLRSHAPAFSSARKAALCRHFCRCYFTLLAIRTGFSYTEHSSGAQIFARS